MPRPKIGSAARSEPVGVRITPHEKILLARQFGSASKGLRAILDEWKRKRGEEGSR